MCGWLVGCYQRIARSKQIKNVNKSQLEKKMSENSLNLKETTFIYIKESKTGKKNETKRKIFDTYKWDMKNGRYRIIIIIIVHDS